MDFMHTLTIIVTNNNDPDCQRMTVEHHHVIPVTADPKQFTLEKIGEAEQELRDMFPRGMTYTMPCTRVIFMPVELVKVAHTNEADRLLRQAYASGQLQGTIIGEKLRDYFGVSYHEMDPATYEEATR